MVILLVDDSPDDLLLIGSYLKSAGYELVTANSAERALQYLTELGEKQPSASIDLILLDVKMTGYDGLDACKRIKSMKQFEDVPILMVSVDTTPGTIQLAFRRGAVDYIRKPVIKVELLAKVAMVLRLEKDAKMRKTEMQQSQERERQPGGTSENGRSPVSIDPLTGIFNWWQFDKLFEQEWGRAAVERVPLSLIFFALENFKAFNDSYGYNTGDECLLRIAQAANGLLDQPGQVVARYRGAEFVALLSGTGAEDAGHLAARLRHAIEDLDLGPTFAFGVATAHPNGQTARGTLLASAKDALTKSKQRD